MKELAVLGVTISAVDAGGLAHRAGISAGDELCSINGHAVEDVLDYRFYLTHRALKLCLRDKSGAEYTKTVRKQEYDELGLRFDTFLMDKQRPCKNKCVFCFVDQLPKGLRESLYFKDDDSRMSFLFGNYITLTNLRPRDVERILAMHISPVNISVHTTNPELRVRMMKNPRAGEVLDYIPRLARGGVKLNAQLVLCPGYNDGPELVRTLRDLCALAPGVQSVAVVPVGLTGHREGLRPLRLFTRGEAAQVCDTVDRFGEEMLRMHGIRVCYVADELYLCAGRALPPCEYYGDFEQLENGVGLVALLRQEFYAALENTPARSVRRRATLVTGRAAYPFLRELAGAAASRFPGLRLDVIPVDNHFFGETITVAGLVTGGDILAQAGGRPLGDALLFPSVMLRHEGDMFLDNMTVEELERRLGVPLRAVDNDGCALLDALLGQ